MATALFAAITSSAFMESLDSDLTNIYHVTTAAPEGKNTVKLDLNGIKNGASFGKVQIWDGTSPEPQTEDQWASNTNVSKLQFSTSNPPPSGHVHNINANVSNAKLRFHGNVPTGAKVRLCISQNGGGNITSDGDTWSSTN